MRASFIYIALSVVAFEAISARYVCHHLNSATANLEIQHGEERIAYRRQFKDIKRQRQGGNNNIGAGAGGNTNNNNEDPQNSLGGHS